jgi:hypothetical protein
MSEDGASYFARDAIVARLRFSPALRELLAAMVQRVHAKPIGLPDAPVTDASAEPDPDWQAAWGDSLRERTELDTTALDALIGDARFGVADLPLTPVAAEAILRGSVRVRLYLRDTVLRNLKTDEIEGHLDVFRLPVAEQQGYACYRLLAWLEEDLLHQLDPDLLRS